MKIDFSHSAVEDLLYIKDYYLNQGVANVGERFVTDIITHVDSLTQHPDIGRIVPEFEDPSIRELIHPPFRIVYLRQKETISIIRVWRSERLLDLN